MIDSPCCPRCGLNVQPPGGGVTGWRCGSHGVVAPVRLHAPLSRDDVERSRHESDAPLWVPWPSPPEWATTGLALAGDPGRPASATAVAGTGPAPLGGMAELVIVAEELGTGLGAGYAALSGPDPGGLLTGAPQASVRIGGRATPLWSLPTRADRCVYVGEALGQWLWAVLWPAEAGVLLLEDLVLHDLREQIPGGVRFGPPSPYLRPGQ
ncbi:MAG: hypothetical protein H0V67_07400 [Geodermatophilaceae bacterium]|nr:hypothetical protein [Geodermatophilaceae bacterium]